MTINKCFGRSSIKIIDQVRFKGKILSLHSLSGSSCVKWVQGSNVANKQPLTWYKVRDHTSNNHFLVFE